MLPFFAQTSSSDRRREYRWLSWIYHQWQDSKPGSVDPAIIDQTIPALSAYARRRTKTSAVQAEELLERLLKEYRAGNPAAQPSTTTFNAAMNAYASIGDPEGANRIVHSMKQDGNLQPDVVGLTTLATAWARSRKPQAPSKAMEILEYMEKDPERSPTTTTYNTVLTALVHSSWTNKAHQAQALVARMKDRYRAGHEECRPSIYTYQLLITAWSRTKPSPRRSIPHAAERILQYLIDQAASGHDDLSPNTHCYTAVINAWAHSFEPEKARRAYELLQDLRHRYEVQGDHSCRPNVVVYSAVLNACCKATAVSDRGVNVAIAQLVWDELRWSEYGPPNFLSYASYLRVCAESMDESQRDVHVRRIFVQACEEGQVGEIVLEKFLAAASPELCRELLGSTGDDILSELVPKTWTRNVKGERRTGKQSKGRELHSTSIPSVRASSGSTKILEATV